MTADDVDNALAALRLGWDGEYEIGYGLDGYWARRRDNRGETMLDGEPEGLRRKIYADYGLRPPVRRPALPPRYPLPRSATKVPCLNLVRRMPRRQRSATAAFTVCWDTPASSAIRFCDGSREPGGNSPVATASSMRRATCSRTCESDHCDIPLQSGIRHTLHGAPRHP